MKFHNTRLPNFVSVFAYSSPSYSTSIIRTKSGREIRRADHQELKSSFTIKDCRLSLEHFHDFNTFFNAREGRTYSFLFLNPVDYNLEEEVIGTGDGQLTRFPLHKTYSDNVKQITRAITHPDTDNIRIWADRDELEKPDFKDGQVILNQPPRQGALIKASCIYYTEVRFNQDFFNYNIAKDGSICLEEIKLIEV